jgi:tyrosinase
VEFSFYDLVKTGENIVRRRDSDSTVTIPYERTFRNYAENQPAEATPEFEQYNYCGCGWPAHLLIPRGSPDGLSCSLFVMVSNYDEDKVHSESITLEFFFNLIFLYILGRSELRRYLQ